MYMTFWGRLYSRLQVTGCHDTDTLSAVLFETMVGIEPGIRE
jgi:hypothetical protein